MRLFGLMQPSWIEYLYHFESMMTVIFCFRQKANLLIKQFLLLLRPLGRKKPLSLKLLSQKTRNLLSVISYYVPPTFEVSTL